MISIIDCVLSPRKSIDRTARCSQQAPRHGEFILLTDGVLARGLGHHGGSFMGQPPPLPSSGENRSLSSGSRQMREREEGRGEGVHLGHSGSAGFLRGVGGGAEDRIGHRSAQAGFCGSGSASRPPPAGRRRGGAGGVCVELAAQVDRSLRLAVHLPPRAASSPTGPRRFPWLILPSPNSGGPAPCLWICPTGSPHSQEGGGAAGAPQKGEA